MRFLPFWRIPGLAAGWQIHRGRINVRGEDGEAEIAEFCHDSGASFRRTDEDVLQFQIPMDLGSGQLRVK